ncbi:hypothetical protein DPMN_170392 [Dreissena polymorpha]|uniref:Uncharacterized protein n=1 Tax=Dreissena polymorpha TaxID=45954 RepID=A0A9D4ID54_DREPO|nr:hypothetical protein DPMN_170392 [Dreissena polymorpha]
MPAVYKGTPCSSVRSHLGLLLEAFPLYHRVVQLCVAITDLLLAHKQLKPLC